MTNQYYTTVIEAVPGTTVRSSQFNDNNEQIEQGFDLLPEPNEIYGATVNFGVSTGTVENTYNVNIQQGRITSYFDGLTIQVRAHQDNTGTAQVNLNGLGNRTIVTTSGDALVANDIMTNNVMVLRYDDNSARFVLDTALTVINDAANRAETAATTATGQAVIATNQAVIATSQAAIATQQAQNATNEADRAEIAADIVGGTLLLTTLPWVQGQTATEPLRRYNFNNNLYVAPEASATNPIALGATPVGDPNWVAWSDPVRFFAYEETTTVDKSVFNVGTTFDSIADVFVDTNLQNTSSYSVDGVAGTVTFNEDVPAGFYVKIWVGRIKDAVVQELQTIRQETIDGVFGTWVQYDAGAIASPTTIFRPGLAFVDAILFAGGVPQQPGASNAYVVEQDSNNANFNQIRFNSPVPAGIAVYGTLRRNVS